MEDLTDTAIAMLLRCCTLSHWHVGVDTFTAAAALVERGFASVYDHGEGLSIRIEELGRQWALSHELIEPDPDGLYEPYRPTAKGSKYESLPI